MKICALLLAALAIPALAADDAVIKAKPAAVLWQAPEKITLQDWIWGPGGQDKAPKPPYEFIEEDGNGTNAKIRVRDGAGNQWTVKFGGEIHSDVFAARMLNAMGYLAEPTYFVASGVVSGAHDLRRAKPFLEKDGRFYRARFKLRDKKSMAKVADQDWSWIDNPFAGSHELSGLKIMLMLMSNWDAKDSRDGKGSNTAIYSTKGSDSHLIYSFDDWGATMGKWGGFFKRDKWNPDGYTAQSKNFVTNVSGKGIRWGYQGKHGRDVTSGIAAADVAWLMTYLSRVTDADLQAGLRASGATEEQIQAYSSALRERITQLQKVSSTTVATAR